MRALQVAVAVLLATAVGAEESPPQLAGVWKLNRGLSDDIAAKMKVAAGSESMSGGTSWAAETILPWTGGFTEGQRVNMREFLLANAAIFQALEIEQSADEIKTIHGESSSRIFNLKRTSSGTSVLGGEKVSRQARYQASQLVLESKGKDSKLVELVTAVPSRSQLTYAVRFEQKLLKSPLELKLVYDKAEAR
jgi:hypothetical protein